MVRFEGSLLRESEVLRLVLRKFSEHGGDPSQVKRRNFFVQMFGQNVNLAAVVFIVVTLI